MKTICSLLLLVFATTAYAGEPTLTTLHSLPLLSPARFSLASGLDVAHERWSDETFTLHLSDRLGIGAVKSDFLRTSVGLKYQATDKVSLMALVSPNPFRADFLVPNPTHRDGSKIGMLAFKITF